MSTENKDFDLDIEANEGGDNNGQKGGESKTRKKFNNAMNLFTQVLGGTFLYKPNVLVPNEIQAAVIELAKEEKEALVKKFKADVLALIQKKREHDKHVAKLKKEFEQKEEQNMEGFIKDANQLFGVLKDIKNIEKSYFDTLLSATEGKKVEEVAKTSTTEGPQLPQ